MLVKDKVALVTGGAQGIGKAIVESLLENGANIVIANRNEELGYQVSKELSEKYNKSVHFIKTDVSKMEDVENAVNYTVEKFGTIDIMINNAGLGSTCKLLDIDMEQNFNHVIDVNLKGTAHGIIAAGRKMRDLGIVDGVILNISSVFGELAQESLFAYQATKAAIIMMTKSAALELSEYGIRVVCLQPGAVATDIMKRLIEQRPEIQEGIRRTHLLGDYVTVEQIANSATFLVSDMSKGVNGTSLAVDDGFTTFKVKL